MIKREKNNYMWGLAILNVYTSSLQQKDGYIDRP